ncbi:hypothetical protein ACIBQ1_58915 [Nonomuraea sp. NPDC050153]|uniref:hypothetical protein n=1 Tax=Nonomuraea sp. NPDC050153 TaxID=3364359 RepID=UPI003797B018
MFTSYSPFLSVAMQWGRRGQYPDGFGFVDKASSAKPSISDCREGAMRRITLVLAAIAALGSFIASPAAAAAKPDWGGIIYSVDWGGLINSERLG